MLITDSWGFSVFQPFLAHCSGSWLSWSLEVGSVEPQFLALRAVQFSLLTFHTFYHVIYSWLLLDFWDFSDRLKISGHTGK